MYSKHRILLPFDQRSCFFKGLRCISSFKLRALNFEFSGLKELPKVSKKGFYGISKLEKIKVRDMNLVHSFMNGLNDVKKTKD